MAAQMGSENLIIPGITKNGVVVPRSDTPLPDGLQVDILVRPADVTPELRAEWERWDRASDEAWAMIEQWEAEERCGPATSTGSTCPLPAAMSNKGDDRQSCYGMTTTAQTCQSCL